MFQNSVLKNYLEYIKDSINPRNKSIYTMVNKLYVLSNEKIRIVEGV